MYLWTSEAVASGHPDKVADQIADGILDEYLGRDPFSRVASEVVVTRNGGEVVMLTGEVTSEAKPDLEPVVRGVLSVIGYDRPEFGFSNPKICNYMRRQSPEIAKAVVKESGELGAGDQGLMFGYAVDETPTLMPLSHFLAFEIIKSIEHDILQGRTANQPSIFQPDAKSQVTIQYSDNGVPERVDTVVVSACHRPDTTLEETRQKIRELLSRLSDNFPGSWKKILGNLFDDRTKYHINPAGEWHLGGPSADTGLSGRKIVVDNYGADCPHGGGSFSGKDPTKVDRSGAYAARHIAKNIVAAGLANKVRVQVAYAIGVVEPVSLRIETFGTNRTQWSDLGLVKKIRELVPLSPQAIIDRFGLRRPIYRQTAFDGHFGRNGFPWENLDLVDKLMNL
jgi:S-adenosylmethionine synthetase